MAEGQTTSAVMQREPTEKEIRLVIAASSAGTVFEWYDFFIYGTLAGLIGAAFFPSGNETLQILLVWAGFAIGFGFRPIGAILFGYLGDRLGRKYTFLVTVTLMGIATAGVGLIPSASSIGIAAPIIVIGLRILQGLALGGEYGGAAIYVAEHAPPEKRGFYTSFIQASVVGGFVLSILVVIVCRAIFPPDVFAAWGWRVPFLLSIILLGISLWMRLKLSESPVFQAMKESGETSANPFIESMTYPGNPKRIFVALFGVAGVLTVIWYTAFFSGLSFLRGPMRVDDGLVEWIMLIAGLISMGFYIVVGRWSDRVGRRKPIIVGALLTLALLFPVFWAMGSLANPGLAKAAEDTPVVVSGRGCTTDPFAELFDREQTDCGKLLETLTASGVAYSVEASDTLGIRVGGEPVAVAGDWLESGEARRDGLQAGANPKRVRFQPAISAIPEHHRDHSAAAGRRRSVCAHLWFRRGFAVGDVPPENPLFVDVDPLSYRCRVPGRIPAPDLGLHRGAHGGHLFGALVRLGRRGIRSADCMVGFAGRTADRLLRRCLNCRHLPCVWT